MRTRLSVIGLDGATFRLVLPWVREGNLPTIGNMIREGAWGELESTIHPLSPQAWASFMTGKNPGKHGIFEFIEHKPNSYDLRYVNGGCIQGEKLWKILSDAGKRVCVINVPFTYPPEEVNGYLVAGLDSPSAHSGFCHPPELMEEITQQCGPYQLRQHPYKATPESYLRTTSSQFHSILNGAKYLKAKEAWDLFVVVFESADLVQHFYWHYAFPGEFDIPPTENRELAEAIFTAYNEIDTGVHELLELCQPDEAVMVMSDHGFAPCRKIFFMDSWLRQQGYLAYRKDQGRAYGLTRTLHMSFQRYFPNRFKGMVNSLVPGLRDHLRSYLTTAPIDWGKTRAFSLGIDSTNIFINLKGRFPRGIVQQGSEYEHLRAEIIQGLMDLSDPDTGKRIVERVYRREDLYRGPCLHKAPDLLVTWKGFEYNTRRGYGREGVGFLGSSLEFSDVAAYSSLQKSGTHHPRGIFIGSGSPFKKTNIAGARIIDLAPTILYLLGVEIPGDVDGRVLAEIFEDDFCSGRPVRFKSQAPAGERINPFEYTESEEHEVRDRLQGLGYVE